MTTFAQREGAGRRAARYGLILFYFAAGIMHFVATDAMARIVPSAIPHPRIVVVLTGACEIAGAIALMFPRWRRVAGWAFAAYALCVWPANMVHAMIDLGGGRGLGWGYHVPRLLFQPVIIWWALWAGGVIDWPFAGRKHDDA